MRKRCVPTKEYLNDALYVQGLSIDEIRESLGYKPSCLNIIYRYLHRYDIPLPPGYKSRRVPSREELYEEVVVKRTPVRDLAVQYGYASGCTKLIYKYLDRYGISPIGTEQDQIRANVSLTPQQREFVIGALLGDGCIPPLRNRYRNFHLQIGHSLKQREYFDWKIELMSPFCLPVHEHLVKCGGKTHQALSVHTITHQDFSEFRTLFYADGVKRVPVNIGQLLTPFAMAVWYMDDGCYKRWHTGRGGYCWFCTECFPQSDQEVLCSALRQFDLNPKVARSKTNFSLRLDKVSSQRFSDLISPFVIPSMRYKLSDF